MSACDCFTKIVNENLNKNKEISLAMLSHTFVKTSLREKELSERVFEALAINGDDTIKVEIAINPNLPKKHWLVLVSDKNESVVEAAKNNIEYFDEVQKLVDL